MSRFGIRYSDRWRFDANGQRLLTLREIWVRLQYLPDDAPLVTALNDGKRRWSPEGFMLADLIEVISRVPYYARPEVAKKRAEEAKQRAEGQQKVLARFAERNKSKTMEVD